MVATNPNNCSRFIMDCSFKGRGLFISFIKTEIKLFYVYFLCLANVSSKWAYQFLCLCMYTYEANNRSL